jgi:hypothetical protein
MGNKTSKLKRKQKNTDGKKKKSLPSPNNVDNVPEDIILPVGASDDQGKNKQKICRRLDLSSFVLVTGSDI